MAPRVRYHDTHENIPVFSGPLYQKGNGIASSLSKVIVPLIRRFSPFLKRNLMKAGKRLASDVLKGESVGTALKKTALQTGRDILSDMQDDTLRGSGSHARAKNKGVPKNKQKAKHCAPVVSDVFGSL